MTLAAYNGFIQTLKRLIAPNSSNIQNMVQAKNFEAFRDAASNGHLSIMERLMELAPNKVQDMVGANNYSAFRMAAQNGHLAVIEKLIEIAPDKVQSMLSTRNYDAFELAVQNGHLAVIERLLNFPEVFANAEMRGRQFSRHIQDFMNPRLASLAQEIHTFQATHPNDIFDITDSMQTKLYFYMMKHLIRQGTPESLNQLNLLLSIPAVKALAHQAVNPYLSPNELLRLAISLNHREAVQVLLNIPAVQQLAQRNHFYQRPTHRLDIEVGTHDRESSMHALTQGEKSSLERVQNLYQPDIDARGVPDIMGELKTLLAQRYNAHPATVTTGDGRVISLPLDFDKFQALAKTLSADTRERALQSYYQHPDHTALRYLSKPNPWMSNHAQYVNGNHQEGAWSTFDEYESLISLLYLAAKDESTPAINGYTIETRIENFIKELSLIGRAHNWDASRINPATGRSEEYDDLQGDKPSCYSGVYRRLFQSVQGHPLLTLLTKDIILQEVRDVVRDHFIHCINDNNCVGLHKAWEAIIDGEEADPSMLLKLNFSEEKQTELIQSISQKLHDKYGPQFNTEMQAYLVATLNVDTLYYKNLAEKFGGQVGLTEILETKTQEMQNKSLPTAKTRLHLLKAQDDEEHEEIKQPLKGR